MNVCSNPDCKTCGWEAHAEYMPHMDVVSVRVRKLVKRNGRYVKVGACIRLTEEMLFQVAEGQEYPCISVPQDRIELILEEVDDERTR